MLRNPLLWLLHAAGVAALYLAVGWAERRAAYDVAGANAVWWPVGLAVLTGWRRPWAAVVGVTVGDFLFTATEDWLNAGSQLASAAGNGAEVFAVLLVLRRAGFDPRLGRVRDVLALVGAAAAGGLGFVLVQAVAVAAGVRHSGWLATDGPVSFAGDTIGVFLVGAVGFPWRRGGVRGRPSAELLVVFAGLAVASYLAFAAPAVPPAWRTVLIPASYPLLVWTAVRFDARAVAAAVAVHVAVVLAVMLHGDGPFRGHGLPREAYPYLHLYYLVAVGTVLLLAAARAEREREVAARRDAERMESLGRLAGGVAHEFNNLMTVVLGNAQLLRFGPPPGVEPGGLLKQIESAAERAGVLTRQLLAFTGRGPVSRRPMDAVAVAKAAARRVHPGIAVSAEDKVPAAVADPALFGMAVENVARNGLEATADQPDAVRVTLSAERLTAADLSDPLAAPAARPGVYVRARVADAGDGAPSDVIREMFEPFFSTKAGRRGLGLAAALGAIKACGGLVRVRSAPGNGTTVDLYVPTAATAPADAPSAGY